MNEKALHTLEFDKILTRLTELAGSESGKALCRELKPLADMREILTNLKETTDAENRLISRGSIAFSGIYDLRASVKRAQTGSSLSIPELLRIRQLLAASSRAKAFGRLEQREEADSLCGYFDALEPLTPFREELDRDLISEEEVADNASPGLAKVRRQMGGIGDRIHTELSSLLIKYRTSLQDAVITMRDGRYCLPVKAENKSQVPGIVHDQSGSGKALFIEPLSVVRLNNEFKELEIQEKKEIELILADLSGKAAEAGAAINTDFEVLTKLDFIFAKARLSRSYKGTAPLFQEKKAVDLKQARHPLLDPKQVVPIDIRLGDAYDLLIITGPNTGGKTVSLKTVGLLTLMGQAGLHIPAAIGSRLTVFREVFADIGDEQSIEQSLSTFSSHMTNIVTIMKEADKDSLVLFDELGAGTDPAEGAALAMAILSRLHREGIRTMATTHYSELKVYALSTDGVENASCEFSVETLRPTYRLLIGIPGKSNAFAIAGKLGLPQEIIEEAGGYIDGNEEAFEDVIAELDKRRTEMEKAESEISRLKHETLRLKEEAEKRQGGLEQQKEKILREAREQARTILQEAKDTADKAIRDLHKEGKTVTREMEDTRASLRLAINDTTGKINDEPKNQRRVTVTEKKLKLGDAVYVHTLGLKGTVSSLPDAKGRIFVQMGILRSEVNAADVELIPEETTTYEGKKRSSVSAGSISKAMSISPEINLIGQTVDDAIIALDKYVDDAYIAHLEKIRIIHGRGTGALRNAVASFLRKNKHVESFETAPYNEGGYGATIAIMKTK